MRTRYLWLGLLLVACEPLASEDKRVAGPEKASEGSPNTDNSGGDAPGADTALSPRVPQSAAPGAAAASEASETAGEEPPMGPGDAGPPPSDAGEPCPSGPQAPSPGTPCSSSSDLYCRYGYEPLECGGRTVICTAGRWAELEHTDPQASCFRDGGPPSQAPAADELCVPTPAPGVGCEYVTTPGTATVTSITTPGPDANSCRNDPVVVRFSFEPDDPRRTRCLKEPATFEHLSIADGKNPPRVCLEAAGISVGTKLRVVRKDIASGSCVPVFFFFDPTLLDGCIGRCWQ